MLDLDEIFDLAAQRHFRLLGGEIPGHHQFKHLLTKVTLTVEYRLEFCGAIPLEPEVWRCGGFRTILPQAKEDMHLFAAVLKIQSVKGNRQVLGFDDDDAPVGLEGVTGRWQANFRAM